MIVPITMYQLCCSFPRCPRVAGGEEYYAWAEPAQCVEMAQDADWRRGAGPAEAGHWFCNDHPTVWASDCEGEEGAWDLGAVADFDFPILVIDDISKNQIETITYICFDQDMLTEGLDRLAHDEPPGAPRNGAVPFGLSV